MAVAVAEGPSFRDELVAAGVLVPTASDGIYGRSSVYEQIVAGIEAWSTPRPLPRRTASYRFPPVMPRQSWSKPATCLHFLT